MVKTLHAADLARGVDEVFREARILRRLSHPAIIGVRDCEYADPAHKARPYLVMDYFPGGTLQQFVEQRGPLNLEQLLAMAVQVAEGMRAAHAQGVLHRDLKPANLLVRKEGNLWKVKIIDFGLALRQQTVETSKVRTGATQKSMPGLERGGDPGLRPARATGQAAGRLSRDRTPTPTLSPGPAATRCSRRPNCGGSSGRACRGRWPICWKGAWTPTRGSGRTVSSRCWRFWANALAVEAALGRIIVSASGDGRYRSITEALRSALPGAEILVRPGVYREGVVLDKPVSLLGDGPAERIVIESADGSCILMATGKAVVRAMTLRCIGGRNGKCDAVDIPRGNLLLEGCDITSDSLGMRGDPRRRQQSDRPQLQDPR